MLLSFAIPFSFQITLKSNVGCCYCCNYISFTHTHIVAFETTTFYWKYNNNKIRNNRSLSRRRHCCSRACVKKNIIEKKRVIMEVWKFPLLYTFLYICMYFITIIIPFKRGNNIKERLKRKKKNNCATIRDKCQQLLVHVRRVCVNCFRRRWCNCF